MRRASIVVLLVLCIVESIALASFMWLNQKFIELHRDTLTILVLRECNDKYVDQQVHIGNGLSNVRMTLNDFFELWAQLEREKVEKCGGRKA